MAISFSQIPSNLRVPLFYAELDNSQANTGTFTQRALIVGQMTSAGTLTPNTPALLQGIGWAKSNAGQGSQLALMAEWYRKRDPFGEVYLLPLADEAGATAATGSVAFTSAATASGTLYLYVSGVLVPVPITTSQTTAQIATAVAAAINANPDLPVTATASTSTVTLTAKNKGTLGNGIDIRLNYRGNRGGEATPAGLGVTITQMSDGATDPLPATFTTAFANLADMPFDFIVFPYTDTNSLDALKAFLADRWAYNRMLYGGAFSAAKGTASTLTTLGAARNDPHVSVMGFNDSPTPAFCWAANYAGAAAVSLRADPGRPLQTLALDVLAPPIQSRFDLATRNTLLWSGVSTHTVGDDGTVRIETAITTYQKNSFGQPDDSYLYVERLYTLAAIIRRLQAKITNTFGRMKLANDDSNFRPGAGIVTPNIIRDLILAEYRAMVRDGLAQDYEAFKASLQVIRNSGNTCRVDALVPAVPIDQLRVLAALIQFRNAQVG
ncbi:MAG: phage tail sheath subtilisin-like domain-containing protein [Microbispora sp.]|nr:phage tail sheath subtilisin-like domain-containing protein [Microbispora sp.]